MLKKLETHSQASSSYDHHKTNYYINVSEVKMIEAIVGFLIGVLFCWLGMRKTKVRDMDVEKAIELLTEKGYEVKLNVRRK